MASEALFRLQQTLNHILIQDHNNPIILPLNQEILSIHAHANVLQSLLDNFPEEAYSFEEPMREVADNIEKIVKSLLSQENPSDCGSIEPTVRHSNRLGELAEKLESTAADVVDYVKINDLVNSVRRLSDSPAFSSSSRPAPTSKDVVVGFDEDLSDSPAFSSSTRPAPTINNVVVGCDEDLIDSSVISSSSRAGPTSNDVVVGFEEDLSNSSAVGSSSRPTPTSKDVVVDFDEDLSDSPAISSSSRLAPIRKDVVVGFDEDLTVMKDRLLGGSSKLRVLPIVGVGGIGKTTLAKMVYYDAFIMQNFEVRAWVTVSQDYSVESIHLNLLASMKGIEGERDVLGENSMESLIHKYLLDKRYLIVMDDICSKKAWDALKMLFPDNNKCSRIISTTRLRDVAAYADPLSPIHMVRFLDNYQSWHLLQRKVFADKVCPVELEDIGKKIVKTCRGLPLLIVMVAGLLARIPKSRKFWNQIAANDGKLETIMSLSYTHLPDHLKVCFLYMGGFPEDYEIRVSELIKLWIAEGFLTSEVVAEECLKDMVERSLVLATSNKSDGKIKSCSLHDIVRDFCIRQGQVEKILLPVMDYLPSPILRRHFLPQVLKNHRRISANRYDLDLMDSMHGSRIHTVICIPQKGCRSVGSVQKFSSLRVLHVLRGNGHLDWEPAQVFDLIDLTYLASNIPSSVVPPAITKFQNLQTLNIYRSMVRLPVQIWRLRQLRHLIAFSFHPLPHPERKAFPLENLQTLSLATNFVCSERMVEMIPNVKKLGICYSKVNIDAGYHLDNLKHLCHLEKLKLEKGGGFRLHRILELKKRGNLPFRGRLRRLTLVTLGYFTFGRSLNLVFPRSLKKLTLCGWELPWRDMTIIGCLPNLQVLKLRNYAFSGECWKTIEGEFGELRLLLIDKSDLHDWTTESAHFPRLECLILHNCPYLFEIPSNIGVIPTLKLIEVDRLFLTFSESTIRIQMKQRESGNDSFQVRLKRNQSHQYNF